MKWFTFKKKKKVYISEEDQQILKEVKREKERNLFLKKKEILNGAIKMICHKVEAEFINTRKKPFEIGDKVCLNLYAKRDGWWGDVHQYKFIENYDANLEVVSVRADYSKLQEHLAVKYTTQWWDKNNFVVTDDDENLKNNINNAYDIMVNNMIRDDIRDTTEWSIKLNTPVTYHICAKYFVKAGSKIHLKIEKIKKARYKITKLKTKVEKLEKQLMS